MIDRRLLEQAVLLVDAHRSRLAFESSEESGTTFTIDLPFAP